MLNEFELGGLPAVGRDRVGGGPDDAQAVRPVEAHVHAVLAAETARSFIVGRRGLPFLCGVKVGDVDQSTGGRLPEAGDTFVAGVEIIEVLTFQILTAFTSSVDAGEVNAMAVARASTDREAIAFYAADLVDEGGGGGPACVVEHRPVKRPHDAIKRVEWAQDTSSGFLWIDWMGPSPAAAAEDPWSGRAVARNGADVF